MSAPYEVQSFSIGKFDPNRHRSAPAPSLTSEAAQGFGLAVRAEPALDERLRARCGFARLVDLGRLRRLVVAAPIVLIAHGLRVLVFAERRRVFAEEVDAEEEIVGRVALRQRRESRKPGMSSGSRGPRSATAARKAVVPSGAIAKPFARKSATKARKGRAARGMASAALTRPPRR